MKWLAERVHLPKQNIFDQHLLIDNWAGVWFYNNCKEFYGNAYSYGNGPYSLATPNLAWSVMNWIIGKGTIHLVPSKSLFPHMGRSLIDACSIR